VAEDGVDDGEGKSDRKKLCKYQSNKKREEDYTQSVADFEVLPHNLLQLRESLSIHQTCSYENDTQQLHSRLLCDGICATFAWSKEVADKPLTTTTAINQLRRPL
jgi:hypothetical protein